MYDINLERISATTEGPALATELWLLAQQHPDLDEFLAQALPRVLGLVKASFVDLTAFVAGKCDTLGDVGVSEEPLPSTLVSESLDEENWLHRHVWTVAPLVHRSETGEVLVARDAVRPELVDSAAASLGIALEGIRARQTQERRVARLAEILRITQEWGQTDEMEPLLTQMAEAATRILRADRASIFLWDKPNKMLVGRPALGVEGNELRIRDNAGIVGQVVQTGQARRVDMLEGQAEIDRTVDRKLGYATNTLLCVPLISKNGELFGAFEVINKEEGNFTAEDEVELTELAMHAAVALEKTQHLEDLLKLHRQIVEQQAAGVQLVGQSPEMEKLRETVGRVAKTELAILILGQNGTGKEVVAQSLHYLSSRRDMPFIAVNCAALAETLLESELFGHEKGAFTDAHDTRIGKFELASGGTLFLDEIGDLSLGGQAKLLRVLEEKVVVRVGGSTPIHTDARVIAATNQNLAQMVADKKFREDLYYRLNVVTINMPPLRDRGDDIVLLADHFLSHFSRQAGRKPPQFTAAARKRLLHHAWPGNVRELRNLMERMAYLVAEDKIDAPDLAFILSPGTHEESLLDSGLDLSEATRRFQIDYIKKVIDRARGNMSDAAEHLGLHRSNLYRKMGQLGLSTSGEEESSD
ncbi:MAG: sigma-54-dependent Fis family transcriptional regulator [Planctomycetales bacterium]|nr:sigma-54-dependent Fis family transcriptional regulator [Planctomycetales bacterium]